MLRDMKTKNNVLKLTDIGGHSRQGDVMLRRINKIPDGLKKVKATFALGEVSGHHHSLEGNGATCFASDENTLAEYTQVTEPTSLTHQEHSTHIIPPGVFEKLYQVEDTSKEIRPVAD